jgi:hypothetical protein
MLPQIMKPGLIAGVIDPSDAGVRAETGERLLHNLD